jgi:hypothetical protein
MIRALLGLALAAGVLAARPAAARAQGHGIDSTYRCVVCHTTERDAFVVGVHAEHGIHCADCHGGDPTARDLPAAHRGRFIGKPGKVATARLCGSCHSDPNKMRQYGIPTGELAEFRTSRHGQLLLLKNDPNAPTCTDCHGTHTIFPPDDARSQVYPANIPGTCARCHSDAKLMGKYNLRTDQFAQYRASAHGVALYHKQNFATPTCVGCHGAHSALPPQVTEIASVCARCHQLVGQEFGGGPHGAAARAGKMPGCLACHSNHGTHRVPPDSIAAVCQKCHGSDTRIRTMALDIQQRVAQATADMTSAERAIGQLSLAGERVGDYRFRYESALTDYLQIALVQHSLDLQRLDDLTRRVRSISVDLDAAAEASAERRWEHKLVLLPVWFLALSALALALLTLRTLKEADGDPHD